MSRPRTRSRRLGGGLLTALLTAPALVLTASPAFATNEVGRQEGADLSSGMSTGLAILLFVLVPLVILLAIAAVVLLPGMAKADRYRPSKGWSARPMWFAGPPDPVAAVQTADAHAADRGGASGDW